MENPYEFLGGAPEQMVSSTTGILVFAECENNEIHEESLIAIGKARELADMLGTGVGVMILNSTDETAARNAGYAGADKVFIAGDDQFQNYNTELYCSSVSDLIKSNEPEIVLCNLSFVTMDFIPRLAQRIQAGFMSGCIALEIDTSERIVLATRSQYNGKLAEIQVCKIVRPQIIMLKPATFPIPILDDLRECTIEKI